MKHVRKTPVPVWVAGLTLGLLSLAQVAFAGGGIELVNKWVWGTNAGWIDFASGYDNVTVYSDHLEGYAWGENIGWIRLGSHTGGGGHTYANTTADNYGVNRSSDGLLSGYAWGTNVGWINFAPATSGVMVDPHTGVFHGYAWAQNVGWISVKGTGYGLVTDFREYRVHMPFVIRSA